MNVEKTITVLPELTFENLSEVMGRRIPAAHCDSTVIPMLWQGLLEMRLSVHGESRTAKLFVPKDTPQGTVFVLMNVPEGQETLSFLESSGWMRKAEERGFCLFVLEPGPDGWRTPEEEFPYLLEGFRAEIQGVYCLPAFAMYVVGYGAVGVGLHKAVMQDPLHVAAAAFLDASEVDSAYLAEYRAKIWDESGRNYGVPFRKIPVPVWLAAENPGPQSLAMLDYWRRAARADREDAAPFDGVCQQRAATPFTPEGDILQIAAQRRAYDPCGPATTDTVYAFLSGYYRYGMGPCSNVISRKVDYAARGVEHRAFTDRNGIQREYLVYIPATYRERGELPLVLAFHGASQSMRNMFENGLWYEIADREGLILAVPESGLEPLPAMLHGGTAYAYRPLWTLMGSASERYSLDLQYVDELLDRVISEYPVDKDRIYCTGHSMGCMMTNYLGSSRISHRFAAMAATCGVLQCREDTGTQKVPMFLTMGEYDLWSHDLNDETALTDALDMWLIRNGLAEPASVQEIRLNGLASISQEGRRHHAVWTDEAGTPWLRYTWIEKRDHMHNPEENHMFWEEWFSRWSIGENGLRCFKKP